MPHLRKPHKKSKTGCVDCKRRRIKCDETRPSCLRCAKKGLSCTYTQPNSKPKFREGSEIFGTKTDVDPTVQQQEQQQQQKQQIQIQQIQQQQPSFPLPLSQRPIGLSANDENSHQIPVPTPYRYLSYFQPHHQQLEFPLNARRLSVPGNVLPSLSSSQFIRNKSLSSTASSNSSYSYKESLLSPEDSSSIYPLKFGPLVDDATTLKISQNIHERLTVQKSNDDYYSNPSYYDDGNSIESSHHYKLPFDQITTLTNNTNSKVVDNFFSNIQMKKNAVHDSMRFPQLALNNDDVLRSNGLDPMFISNKMDFSNLSSLHLNETILSYACMSDILFKLQFYILNELSVKLYVSSIFQSFILECIQKCPLYDFLFHTAGAVSLLTLYHKNKADEGDEIFNYSPDVYLSLASYHISRGLQSLSNEVKTKENSNKTVCLYISSLLHILYSILTPNQKMASRTFLMNYKNSHYIYQNFQPFSSDCKYKEIDSVLNSLDCNPNNQSIYFPNFLFSLVDTNYPSTSHLEMEKMRVDPLNESQSAALLSVLHWLNKLYKLPNTEVNTDFFVTVQRIFENVNDEFIDLVAIGEPRSLIVIGYAIMLLASKNNRIFDKKCFNGELEFIFSRLNKLDNSDQWKAWLNPVIEMINS